MVAIAEAIGNFKHRGRRRCQTLGVCSAADHRFSNSPRLFVDRCSLTVDEGQDPAGYPGAAAHCRAGRGTGFHGAGSITAASCARSCSIPALRRSAALGAARDFAGSMRSITAASCARSRSTSTVPIGINLWNRIRSMRWTQRVQLLGIIGRRLVGLTFWVEVLKIPSLTRLTLEFSVRVERRLPRMLPN